VYTLDGDQKLDGVLEFQVVYFQSKVSCFGQDTRLINAGPITTVNKSRSSKNASDYNNVLGV
jgi:hypothetical protein